MTRIARMLDYYFQRFETRNNRISVQNLMVGDIVFYGAEGNFLKVRVVELTPMNLINFKYSDEYLACQFEGVLLNDSASLNYAKKHSWLISTYVPYTIIRPEINRLIFG